MEMISIVNVDATSITRALQEVRKRLDDGGLDTVLDFSSVSRLDALALQALQEFAFMAGENQTKVTLRGVNVTVYKALKLAKVTRPFLFLD